MKLHIKRVLQQCSSKFNVPMNHPITWNVFFLNFYVRMISNLQKSSQHSTEKSYVEFTQLSLTINILHNQSILPKPINLTAGSLGSFENTDSASVSLGLSPGFSMISLTILLVPVQVHTISTDHPRTKLQLKKSCFFLFQ